MDLSKHGVASIVLGAGTSSRMAGRHKLALHLNDGRTVLEHAVAQAAGWNPAQAVVVMQPGMEELRAAIEKLPVQIVTNPDFASGMASSLRTGVAALRGDVSAVLVLLGDQPLVSERIIEALVEAFETGGGASAIAIPSYGGVPGPPTLFRRSLFSELLALTGDEGGRSVVRRAASRVAVVPLPAGAMPPDIDTPEDYERYMSGGGA